MGVADPELEVKNSSVSPERDVETGDVIMVEGPLTHGLDRRLTSRHIWMISIGSAIGEGLWLGSGGSLHSGGPASLWIGFWIAASIGWALNQSIGELAVLYPVPSAFPQWTRGLVDPAAAFMMGWTYWFSYMITIPNELAGLVTVLAYWDDSISPAVWISVFLVVLILINVFAVNVFAEAETVMSFLKFSWIIIVVVCSIVISAGGGPTHKSTGFHYWREKPFINGFKGFLSVMPNCIFALTGIELSGVVAAEARNPKASIPKSVQSIWLRLGFFYILGSFMVTITTNPNDPNLFGSGSSASPFVIAFKSAGLPGLAQMQNVIILISVLSSGNAAMYCSGRLLLGLAELDMAPKLFKKCDSQGRPWPGFILTTIIGGGLAYLNVDNKGSTVFGWFSNLTSLCALVVWGLIFLSSLRMRIAWKYNGRSLSELPWKSSSMPYAAYWGLFWCLILIVVEFYLAVWPLGAKSTARTFFANYVSVVLMIVVYIGAKIYYRGPLWIHRQNIDLDKKRFIYTEEHDLPEPDAYQEIWTMIKGKIKKDQ
ncbi:amino acid permease GAP1 [Sugiyamaella lignohabitans]|uniref:Amino acid permease GAP1 n=1 Tax=Sugiyamaella lignohabitans TaxID=796027 RepID=A0A167DFU9_9ASCO|nr:amino acid permease GAP1 [Sugiyamaella lignohabitans]ANB12871.1 amino acid permease GAP1 [Sugiyamaella lignohabitans]